MVYISNPQIIQGQNQEILTVISINKHTMAGSAPAFQRQLQMAVDLNGTHIGNAFTFILLSQHYCVQGHQTHYICTNIYN
jgi:hypothetical protein